MGGGVLRRPGTSIFSRESSSGSPQVRARRASGDGEDQLEVREQESRKMLSCILGLSPNVVASHRFLCVSLPHRVYVHPAMVAGCAKEHP